MEKGVRERWRYLLTASSLLKSHNNQGWTRSQELHHGLHKGHWSPSTLAIIPRFPKHISRKLDEWSGIKPAFRNGILASQVVV